MYRIHQIKLSLEEELDVIPKKIREKVKERPLTITHYKVVKESIDARKKSNIQKVYTVDFQCKEKLSLEPLKEEEEQSLSFGQGSSPIVVGFGPCGIFAALRFAEAGAKPIVLERGKAVENRVKDVESYWKGEPLNVESNVQFGEGGAGAFSDGKLTTGINSPYIRKVLKELSDAGGGKEILYKNKPHIGTDLLRKVVITLRKKIIELGGQIYFEHKVKDLQIHENSQISLSTENGKTFESDKVILAIGHSARDTMYMLYEKGLVMEQKPFSMGVRIEHDQSLINKAQYGNEQVAKKLGPADYQLSHRCKSGRGVYTFCMCPGGEIIMSASEKDTIVTNGMSYHARDGEKANSGLLVDVRCADFPSSHPLAGIELQRKYEKLAFEMGRGKAPTTRWGNWKDSTLKKVLPEFVSKSIEEAMPYLGNKLRGFDGKEAILVGVETRSSSPVRLIREKNYRGNLPGIYPAGEGAGYAGGIVSAAVDGLKIGEEIIKESQ